MIILICLAFPPLCLLTFFSFTYFTASSSWLPPFLLNYQPLSGVLPSLSSLRLGGTEWRALYSPFKSVFPLAFSLIFLGALNIESIRSFTFSGWWVPCKVHAALQTGTPLSVSASASVWACVCDQCGPSPCPTEADPNHHVSSVPSPYTWLGPVLQKKDYEEVSFYLPALPDSFPPLFLEDKRSLLPLEDQSPPVLSAIFPVSPAAALWAYPCSVDLP